MVKKMVGTDDLWEIRIEWQSNIYRFLGFMDKGKLIILTNGFLKKTNETPKREIELAEGYKKDYLRRIKP
jgi:phage-related protein